MQDKTSIFDEKWDGSDAEELSCMVSEVDSAPFKYTRADRQQLCYIHSKLMIVDDRRVICGSSNLNDRSQKGDHDSEIAIVIGEVADDRVPMYVDSSQRIPRWSNQSWMGRSIWQLE